MSPEPSPPKTKFSSIDELIADQGDVAVIIEEDPTNPGQFVISVYMDFDSSSPSSQDISYSYLSACDLSVTENNLATSAYISCDSDTYSVRLPSVPLVSSRTTDTYTVPTNSASQSPLTLLVPVPEIDTSDLEVDTFATRKYKPVALSHLEMVLS